MICLAFTSLMTMAVISFLIMVRMERATSTMALDRVQAELLADVAADSAVERLRETIDSGRTFDEYSYSTWSSEPGRIHVYHISQEDGTVARTPHDMFSAPPGPDNPACPQQNNVDLNATMLSGRHVITGSVPGTMKVGWKNMLANPAAPASASNQITGRIAYWVDDESCKVNINTADGAFKNLTPKQMEEKKQYSYGFGVPSEISFEGFENVTQENAAALARYAAEHNFNSVNEAGLVDGLPENFLADNIFSLSYTSRSPDLNMLGEPRIPLVPTWQLPTELRIVNAMVGPYGGNTTANMTTWSVGGGGDATRKNFTGPMDFLYPESNQLPQGTAWKTAPSAPKVNLPQYLQGGGHYVMNSSAGSYTFGLRIAKYLQGFNSLNQPFKWPHYPGCDDGFVTKYSLRQIDSIVLQILDVVGNNTMADQVSVYTMQAIMRGWLSTEVVCGIGRAPGYTEVLMTLDSGVSSEGPYITLSTRLESYFPKYYLGAPLDYTRGSLWQWGLDAGTQSYTGDPGGGFNTYDLPTVTPHARVNGSFPAGTYPAPSSKSEIIPCALVQAPTPIPNGSGFWQNNMLRFLDGGEQPAGIDAYGWHSKGNTSKYSSYYPDPDQSMAEMFHPWTRYEPATCWTGSNTYATEARPFWRYLTPTTTNADSDVARFCPGSATAITNFGASTIHRGKKGMSFLKVRGGLAMWSHTESGPSLMWAFAPMDSIAGPIHLGIKLDSEEKKQRILDAVVPVKMDTPIPGRSTLLLRVADPLVNKFPGDWEMVDNPAPADISMRSTPVGDVYARHYAKGGDAVASDPDFPPTFPDLVTKAANVNPDNPGWRPKAENGGDLLSVWLPNQDLRIPKQARFPSIGALNFIRTGMIPDDMEVEYSERKGIPWRSICFDAMTSPGQRTLKGSYPDWAMLDLFFVPFLPQEPEVRPDRKGSDNPRRIRMLTSGGSTEGRLNINNPRVPYPFAETFPGVSQTGPERRAPLKALFKNIQISTKYNDETEEPEYTTVDHEALANAVQAYLMENGPFMLTGELANVPEIADCTYKGVSQNAWSRNDLVRKVIGATTTQSNTFSIWVVSQTIKKAAGNTLYGTFEPGDQITGEVRRRYLVERLIEPGKDGVPGNAKFPGTDNILGTLDDVINPDFHPKFASYPLPYRWRILSVEDVAR